MILNEINTTDDLVEWYPGLQTVTCICYTIILLIGITGNLLVIIVVTRYRDMRNATNLLLTNLSIADLFVLLFCTPDGYQHLYGKDKHRLGKFMCSFSPFVQNATSTCSVLTIMAISYERYVAICQPLKTSSFRFTLFRTLPTVIFFWFISCLISIPFFIYSKTEYEQATYNETIITCFTRFPLSWTDEYLISCTLCPYLLIFLMLCYWHFSICCILFNREALLRDNTILTRYRRQVAQLLIVLIISFFILILPHKIWAFIQQNLHVVLCFSPVGEKFRKRGLQFPGLVANCTIDWFLRWPRDALVAVADHFLASFNIVCTDAIKKELVQCMGSVHDGVAEYCLQYFQKYRRSTHVTPKSYLSFINGYKEIYSQKLNEIESMAKRMNDGLTRLVEAEKAVIVMKEELTMKEKELDIANKKADEVLKEVAVKKGAAEIVKQQVQKVKDTAQTLVDEINRDKLEANAELENAKPALLAAEEALLTITPADIAVVRKLGRPPRLIRQMMDCVLILFGRPLRNPIKIDPELQGAEPSWENSLKLMSDTGFLQSLQAFPRDRINGEQIELLQPYFRVPDYTPEGAKVAAGAVAGLLTWTRAMADFYNVNKRVLPLKANLAMQEARLAKANAQLQTAQDELDRREAEVAAAQAEYDTAMAIKQRLQDDLDRTLKRMNAARELISGLADEQERWTEQSKQFKAQIGRLVGDVLLCTGFLSYQGPFNQDFRLLLAKDWQKLLTERTIPFTRTLNVTEYLTDVTIVGEWKLQGLPNDELSIQNAIIVTRAKRYPLLIDPQGQGKAWIKNKEATNDLQSTNLLSKHFRQHLEDCLSLGRPILIEDVGEELDPALDNVLEKNFIRSGSTLKVKVGDKEVDILKGFNLYITTKLANPAFTPEISAKTSVIDFTVTIKGLEDQLLGLTILKEKAELENERVKMLEDIQANNKRMKELEDNLLFRLSNSKGSLVDDDDLIRTLKTTKVTSTDVKQKLQIATETSQKINIAREEYRPVATRGSIIYFLIVEMSLVNVMYQTSLKQFLQLFDQALERSPRSPVTSKRITNIMEFLTYEMFKYAVRGYYEEHKFMFTLLLALKIDLHSGKLKFDEFQTLIKGGAAVDASTAPTKPAYKWLQNETWLNLVELSKLYQFGDVLNSLNGAGPA